MKADMTEAHELLRRLADLADGRGRGDRALAAEAIRHFDRTGDTRLIREWVEAAERRATLLHHLDCRCRICRRRNGR